MKKKVLIIVSKKPKDENSFNWYGLSRWLQRLLGDVEVQITSFDQLVYVSGGGCSVIYHPIEGYDIANFDLVLIRKVGDELERGIAVAHYLDQKGTPFTDSYLLTQGKGKLACSFARQKYLPVPKTVYASQLFIATAIKNSKLRSPFVLKADNGKKGQDNFLIQSFEEMQDVLQRLQNTTMIVQEYIPNRGDYRFLVLGGKVRLILLRKGKEGSYLNNTSQGGSAEVVDVRDFPQDILDKAEQAARIERLEIAGVDIIQDITTGEYYVLEVNRAPQIATGACNDEKMIAYSEMVADYLSTNESL